MLRWLSYGIAALALLFAVCCFVFRIHVNLTPSMPLGFYRELPGKPIKRGDTVAACLPAKLEKLGLARGYLTRGSCPGGSAPVLKEVIGVPGDVVIQYADRVCVNQRCYPAPILARDQQGRVIPHLAYRQPIKLKDAYWLYGSADPVYSWDSRYFGSISAGLLVLAVPFSA